MGSAQTEVSGLEAITIFVSINKRVPLRPPIFVRLITSTISAFVVWKQHKNNTTGHEKSRGNRATLGGSRVKLKLHEIGRVIVIVANNRDCRSVSCKCQSLNIVFSLALIYLARAPSRALTPRPSAWAINPKRSLSVKWHASTGFNFFPFNIFILPAPALLPKSLQFLFYLWNPEFIATASTRRRKSLFIIAVEFYIYDQSSWVPSHRPGFAQSIIYVGACIPRARCWAQAMTQQQGKLHVILWETIISPKPWDALNEIRSVTETFLPTG